MSHELIATKEEPEIGPQLLRVAKEGYRVSRHPTAFFFLLMPLKIGTTYWDLTMIDEFFNEAILGLFSAYQITYLGLAGYILGLLYLCVCVEASKKEGPMKSSKTVTGWIDFLFNAPIGYVSALMPVLLFLNWWSGNYWHAVSGTSMLVLIWLSLNVFRDIFKNPQFFKLVKKAGFWPNRVGGYAMLLTAWFALGWLIVSETFELTQKAGGA